MPDPADRRVPDLLAVLDIARRLAATTDVEPLLAAIGDATRAVLGCDRASVFLHDPAADELYVRLGTDIRGIRFPAGRGIAGAAFRSGEVLHVPDAYADPRFSPAVDKETGYRTHAILACPLVGWDGVPVGVMQAINKLDGAFTEWDQVLLRALAAQAGAAVQRQALFEAFREKQRLDRDLGVARVIQQRLLPTDPPSVPGYALAGWNQPADATGGDFYDWFRLPDGRLVVAIGDATGHGIGPSLMTTTCRAFARAVLSGGTDLGPAVGRVNQLLSDDFEPGHFVTAFFGVLDPKTHRLTYLSAGQGPVLVYRAATGVAEELATHGLPLAAMPEDLFDPPGEAELRPGDSLVLMTDGFYEWADAGGERFETDRMVAVLRATCRAAPADVIQTAYAAVIAFANGTAQRDDLTAVVLRRGDV
jgi:phosphoserine phosphatase